MIASTIRRRLLQSWTYVKYKEQGTRARTIVHTSAIGRSASYPCAPLVPLAPTNTPTTNVICNIRYHSTSKENSDNKSHEPPTPSRFEDLALHPQTLEAIQRQGIHKLTEIQGKSYDLIRNGNNLIARSRTGSGKTLAFLLPCIERIVQSECNNNETGIPILVLAPTRELAAQISKEANKLLVVHNEAGNRKLCSQAIYGGSSKKEDVRRFEDVLPTVLVATPGRLKDHLATTTVKITCSSRNDSDNLITYHREESDPVSFRSLLQKGKLQTLILDETDRLLELGFRKDVQDILSSLNGYAEPSLPLARRQTLLFSATLPHSITDIVDLAMSVPNDKTNDKTKTETTKYRIVDCVQDGESITHTNDNTGQSYIVLPAHRFWTGTIEVILQLMMTTNNKGSNKKKNNNKIIVFFEMTSLVQLYSKFLSLRLGHTVGLWEIHGKMQQRERTMVARRFSNASQGILLTSDVSARGVDYPDVSHVIQVGASQSRETYIHRLGRTGRAGKHGQGVLILPELEQSFVTDELRGLDLILDESLQQQLLSKRKKSRAIENELRMLRHDLTNGMDSTGMEESIQLAYHSLISYYFQSRRNRDHPPENFIAFINRLVQDFGLPELPAIDFRRAKKIGIEKLSGLNIRKTWNDQSWDVTNARKASRGEDSNDLDDWFGVNPPKRS